MSEVEQNTSGKKLNELRVVDLKHELEKRNLDRGGVKTALIERLTEALKGEGKDPENYVFEGISDIVKPTKTTPRSSRRSHGSTEVSQQEDSCDNESPEEAEENGDAKELNKEEEKTEKPPNDQEGQNNLSNALLSSDGKQLQPRVLLSPLNPSLVKLGTIPNSDKSSPQASAKEPEVSSPDQNENNELAEPNSNDPKSTEDSAVDGDTAKDNEPDEKSVDDLPKVDSEKAVATTPVTVVQESPKPTVTPEKEAKASDVEKDISKPATDIEMKSPDHALDNETKSPQPTTEGEEKSSKKDTESKPSVVDTGKKASKLKATMERKSPRASANRRTPGQAAGQKKPTVPATAAAKKVLSSPAVKKYSKSPAASGKSPSIDNKSPTKPKTAIPKKKPATEKKDDSKSADSKDRRATRGENASPSKSAATESTENGQSTDKQSVKEKKSVSNNRTSRSTKRKVSESEPVVEKEASKSVEDSEGAEEKAKAEESDNKSAERKKSRTDAKSDSDEKKGERKKRADGESEDKKSGDKKDSPSKGRRRRSRSRDKSRRDNWNRMRPDRRLDFRRPFVNRRGNDNFRIRQRPFLNSRKSPLSSPVNVGDRFSRMADRRRDSPPDSRAAEIARKNRDEALRIERERDRLRLEKEKLERLRAEVLRKEREQQRAERERLERERDELRRRSQLQMEDRRGALKRPFEDSGDAWDRGTRSAVVREIEAPPRFNDYARPPPTFAGRTANQFEGRRRAEIPQETSGRRVTEPRASQHGGGRRRNLDRRSREKAFDRSNDRNHFESGRGRTIDTPQPWGDSTDRQSNKYSASQPPPAGSNWGTVRGNQNWIPVVGQPVPQHPHPDHWSRIESHGQHPNVNRQSNIGPPSQLPPVFGGPRNEIMGGSAPVGNYGGNRYNVVRRF